MSDNAPIVDAATEKAAIANTELAAQYPAPANNDYTATAAPPENSYAAPTALPVSMTDEAQATAVAIEASPYVAGEKTQAWVASPNKYMDWMTSAGVTKGLCIGYGILSLMAFLVMCMAGAANNSVWGGFGWQIFNGLQGWLYAAVLAVYWGSKPAYDQLSRVFSALTPEVLLWVWIGVNGVQVICWIAAMGNVGAWGNCGNSFWGSYWGNICSLSSAVLAFDVFCFFGWLTSLAFALLEKFAPKYVGNIGWKPVAAQAAAVEVKPVQIAMTSSDPVNNV